MANKNKQQHEQLPTPLLKKQEVKENVFLFIPNIIGTVYIPAGKQISIDKH